MFFPLKKFHVIISDELHDVHLKGEIKTGRQQYLGGLHATYMHVVPNFWPKASVLWAFLIVLQKISEVSGFLPC